MAQYIGQYEVIKDLGAGRSGTVYLAVGEVPARGPERPVRRIVAIKRLRDVVDRDRVTATLKQRLSLIEQVKDPRFVEVFEILPDEPAIVMEYVHGVTLARALDELRKAREQVFTEAAVEIGVELAEALYRANSTPGRNGEPLGLVHQRVCPTNVMLTGQAAVRVLDFTLGGTGLPVGGWRGAADDLLYLAPEQARREEIDGRTDLFSVGLLLYELLMNQPAYKGEGDATAELQRIVATGDLREACRSLEQTLPALGPILRRLLQARPEDRYKNGSDLLVDLRRQLYRERGAYLKEFCEFYFGAIHKLGPAPDLEEYGGAKGRSKSIQERLLESRAREGGPGRPNVSVSPVSSAPPRSSGLSEAPRAGPPPRAIPPRVTPRDAAPPVPKEEEEGASMSNGGKKIPPRPPVGGPASRAQPPSFGDGGAKKGERGPLKVVGERRPDETGMLEMVPLSSGKDKAEVVEDPSATSFFPIPQAPKAERSRPAPPPASLGGGPVGVGPPPGLPPGPPVARPPIGGPVAQGPIQPIVQGPVVSYGGGGGTPFQVSGPTPVNAPPPEADRRVQSNRVYAILVGVFLLVAVAVVAAVWIIPPKREAEKLPDPPVATATPAPIAEPEPEKDTAPPPAPVEKPKPKPKATTPKPTPAPSKGPATLTVALKDASQATSVEVVCPSGFRQRSALAGGRGSIASVPQEDCTLYFKGGAPAQYKPVRGGQSLSCSIQGTTGLCN